ncbi:unnamed protein product [Mytilus coruscus]|uniref:Uncharacterized protein n=1 Tax=Mytilus coruscus TaxID=42192 RepID=A0A6J8C1C7_MYTCO|nr:unnamed protein product [Mytilus coruscus]
MADAESVRICTAEYTLHQNLHRHEKIKHESPSIDAQFVKKNKYICYHYTTCKFTSSNVDSILIHTIDNHVGPQTFSFRKKVLDENTGHSAYRSVHFGVEVTKLKVMLESGYKANINLEEQTISFKRCSSNLKVSDGYFEERCQTELNSDLYELLPNIEAKLKEMGRYEDFFTVLKSISNGILTENIAFHLLLDVGRFYSQSTIYSTRYVPETLAFRVTIKKLFKELNTLKEVKDITETNSLNNTKHITDLDKDNILAVNVTFAQFNFRSELSEWESDNPFNGSWNMETENGLQYEIHRLYAQPMIAKGQMIQPIIDPHHLFVNNRARCCAKGLPGMGISSEAWGRVAENCKENGTGLSLEIAKELRDRQKKSYAQTTFSEKVQFEMIKNGDYTQGEWYNLIRNWYAAIDEGGMCIEKRIECLLAMREKLLLHYHVGNFPPSGAYVASLPMTQFEWTMSNIDRRL